MASVGDRLWSRVVLRPRGCWLWTGARRRDGYGTIWFNGRPEAVHRVAWMLSNGPIPDGLFVCHTCDNPPCCRPSHLFLGTPADNTRDSVTKGRHVNPPNRWSGRRTTNRTTA